MIIFQGRAKFLELCRRRYWFLLKCYMKLKSPFDLFGKGVFNLPNNSFWNCIVSRFKNQEPVIVLSGHKGATRKKLYMIGSYFGYLHTIKGQTQIEVTCRRGRNVYAENKLNDFSEGTLAEIKRLRINWPSDRYDPSSPGVWFKTEQVTCQGDSIYHLTAGADVYKRGIMCNSSGIITFRRCTEHLHADFNSTPAF